MIHPFRILSLLAVATLAFAVRIPLQAQEPAPQEVAPQKALTAATPSRQVALESLVENIQALKTEIERIKSELAAAQTDAEKATLEAALKEAEDKLSKTRFDLLNVATNVDLSGFQAVEPEPFSLQGSLEDLMRPIIEEIRRATEDTRQVQKLRESYDIARERGTVVSQALASLDKAIAVTANPAVVEELMNLRRRWSERNENLQNEIKVLAYQINSIESQRRSIISETSGIITRFFRQRGKNLVLALVAAVLWLVALRYLQRHLHEKTRIFRDGRSTATRIFDVVLYFSAFVGAVVAALMLLMIVGDWVLVALIVLILIALILSTKDTLPGYADEIRLILNIGSVRERERIIFAGVPWLVEKLTFFTILRNPALRGGMIRMPIGQLVGMLSRPSTDREPYFPCEEGDWVLLDDETYGRVIFQSVEMVRIVQLGGAQKTYSTEGFLAQNPQNFSHGFRITTTVGIDYSHQPKSTTDILEKLKAFYKAEVFKEVDHALVKSIKVEFAYANTSSLDYDILFDVDGELAPRYRPMGRLLQRIGVDACNKFGLGIPFQQVTIHRAAAGGHEVV